MIEWTPERIEQARKAYDTAIPIAAQPIADYYVPGVLVADLHALARIGLAVVEAREETVERVAKRLCVARYADHHGAAEVGMARLRWLTNRVEYLQQARAVLAALAREDGNE